MNRSNANAVDRRDFGDCLRSSAAAPKVADPAEMIRSLGLILDSLMPGTMIRSMSSWGAFVQAPVDCRHANGLQGGTVPELTGSLNHQVHTKGIPGTSPGESVRSIRDR